MRAEYKTYKGNFKRQEWKFNDMRLNKGMETEFIEGAAECMCARGW